MLTRKLSDRFGPFKEERRVGNLLFSLQDDAMEVEGLLEADIIFADGRTETINFGKNVITVQGRSNMAHLFAGNDVANRMVSLFRFGDEGHEIATPTQPKPVSTSDTDLFGSLIIEKAASVEFPDGASGTKVRFTCSISDLEGNGDSNGQAWSEVGLYDLTGRMMTHKTFGLITKSTAFGIAWRYTILF